MGMDVIILQVVAAICMLLYTSIYNLWAGTELAQGYVAQSLKSDILPLLY